MAVQIYAQIKDALRNLNPEQVREMAARRLTIGLAASSREAAEAMERELVGEEVSEARQRELAGSIYFLDEPDAPREFDLIFSEEPGPHLADAVPFSFAEPRRAAREALAMQPDLELALASHFALFRRLVIGRIIRSIAKENAGFSLLTALPDVVPSFIELPWSVGEFASDTVVLTMNQVRMAFLIAAASNRDPGYRQQRAQIGAIVGGAIGWRALARELVGKIPFGGGLIPKAAIAYAGTYTVGVGLERYYRIGSELTRRERRAIYQRALQLGREIAESLAAVISAATGAGGARRPPDDGALEGPGSQ